MHILHVNIGGEWISKEHSLIITLLEVCIKCILHGDGSIGLFEGYKNIKPLELVSRTWQGNLYRVTLVWLYCTRY